MIRFTSKIGSTMFLSFSFMVALNICLALVWGVFGIWIPFVVVCALTVLLVLPPFFGTFYYLTENEVKITSFLFCFKKIAYEDIVVAIPKQKLGFYPALSTDGIEIVYMKNGVTKTTFVSPAMFETFLNQLTDNIMVTNVMKSDKASVSAETKQYLLKKQEIEEERAKNLPNLKPAKKPAKKTVKKPATKKTVKKTVRKTTKKV